MCPLNGLSIFFEWNVMYFGNIVESLRVLSLYMMYVKYFVLILEPSQCGILRAQYNEYAGKFNTSTYKSCRGSRRGVVCYAIWAVFFLRFLKVI